MEFDKKWSGKFYLIPLFKVSQISKWKSFFFPFRSIFCSILGFWGLQAKYSDFWKSIFFCTKNDRLEPTVAMQNLLWKKTPCAEIFAKNILVMALHTRPQPNFMFSQISWSRVMGFSNHFLHLNCRIVMFVLSIIKGK